MKISVSNPVLSEDEESHIETDYSSGTNIYVRNNEGFTTSWFVVAGEPGQEQTEGKQISTTSGNDTIVIPSALNFSHPKSVPVYLSQWNQISFERKPTGGSYSELGKYNIEWDNENLSTLIVVAGGTGTDTYKWRFYNSVLTTYSDYSDELAGTGFTRYTAGYVIQQVKRNPVAENIDDEIMLNYMNDYQSDVVYPELPKAFWFAKEGTEVATVADDYTYNISNNWDDFLAMKFMLYRYINGSTDITYPLTFSPDPEFRNLKSDASQPPDDYAKQWSLLPPDASSDKGYIGLHPTPKNAVCFLKPVYYFELPDVNSFGDRLVVPHPKGYIDYVLYRIFDDIKTDTSNADKYNARVFRSITYLKRLARRQLGQPEFFRFRGHRGWSRYFGEQTRNTGQTAREMYW